MKLKDKKILVTGGAGFIGSYIVRSLVDEGAKVIVYDNFSTGKLQYLQEIKDKIEIIKGDILDYRILKKACKSLDLISHHAAQLEIFKCIEDPIGDLKVNTIGTLNILELAREKKVQKMVNASSVSVYGQAVELPQGEDHPTDPNWAYGVSKLAAEKYCQIYNEHYGIPIVSLRYGQVYGVREWFGRVLTIFIKRMLENQPLVIFGGGDQMRDLIYVSDAAECHNTCLKNERLKKGILNVGSGNGVSIKELAKIVLKIFDSSSKIIYEDTAEGEVSKHVPYRKRIPCELKSMAMDIEKARRVLRWSPKVSLEEGIRKTIEWVSINPRVWDIEGKDIVNI